MVFTAEQLKTIRKRHYLRNNKKYQRLKAQHETAVEKGQKLHAFYLKDQLRKFETYGTNAVDDITVLGSYNNKPNQTPLERVKSDFDKETIEGVKSYRGKLRAAETQEQHEQISGEFKTYLSKRETSGNFLNRFIAKTQYKLDQRDRAKALEKLNEKFTIPNTPFFQSIILATTDRTQAFKNITYTRVASPNYKYQNTIKGGDFKGGIDNYRNFYNTAIKRTFNPEAYGQRIENLQKWEAEANERSQKLDDLYRKIPNLKGDTYIEKGGRILLSAPQRLVSEFPERIALSFGKGFAITEGLFYKDYRPSVLAESWRAAKQTPKEVAYMYNPKNPAFVTNVILTAVAVRGVAKSPSNLGNKAYHKIYNSKIYTRYRATAQAKSFTKSLVKNSKGFAFKKQNIYIEKSSITGLDTIKFYYKSGRPQTQLTLSGKRLTPTQASARLYSDKPQQFYYKNPSISNVKGIHGIEQNTLKAPRNINQRVYIKEGYLTNRQPNYYGVKTASGGYRVSSYQSRLVTNKPLFAKDLATHKLYNINVAGNKLYVVKKGVSYEFNPKQYSIRYGEVSPFAIKSTKIGVAKPIIIKTKWGNIEVSKNPIILKQNTLIQAPKFKVTNRNTLFELYGKTPKKTVIKIKSSNTGSATTGVLQNNPFLKNIKPLKSYEGWSTYWVGMENIANLPTWRQHSPALTPIKPSYNIPIVPTNTIKPNIEYPSTINPPKIEIGTKISTKIGLLLDTKTFTFQSNNFKISSLLDNGVRLGQEQYTGVVQKQSQRTSQRQKQRQELIALTETIQIIRPTQRPRNNLIRPYSWRTRPPRKPPERIILPFIDIKFNKSSKPSLFSSKIEPVKKKKKYTADWVHASLNLYGGKVSTKSGLLGRPLVRF